MDRPVARQGRPQHALRSANSYTDQRFTAWNDTFTQYQQAVDQRFIATDRRISQIGAMSSAMTQMTANAVPAQAGNGRMAIGSFTFGASASRDDISAGAGFGFDL